MTDELERLKKALRDSAPAAGDGARQRALAAAMAAFDEEISAERQGSLLHSRQRNRAAAQSRDPIWRRIMAFAQPSLRHVLTGGASVAVLALALVATSDTWRDYVPILEREAQRVAGVDSDATTPPATTPATGGTATETPADRKPVAEGAGARAAADKTETTVAANQAEAPADDSVAGGRPAEVDAVSADEVSGAAGATTAARTEQQRAADVRAPVAESEELLAPSAPPAALADSAVGGQSLGREAASAAPSRRLRAADGAEAQVGMHTAPQAQALAKVQSQSIMPEPMPAPGYQDQGRDQFTEIVQNPVKVTREEPVSTFSIDVDTASYSFVRGALKQGVLPQHDAVRVEELINYFPYDYAGPASAEEPFAADVTVMPTPWNEGTKLLTIGIKGYELLAEEKPRSNLVFLIDTSGSMNSPDKLPLLVNSFRLLVDTLDPDDTVAIVAYAGSAGTVLEPTKVSEKAKILASFDRLAAGGSTAGAEGIRQAYQLAEANFAQDGVNRVFLATDGDFNVGITNPEELKSFVERKRETGIYLSVLGFGRGNYNDEMMQTLAQNGNGVAAYIDELSEARKVLVEEATSTLFPIAKDVKIQIELNPAVVSEYRLIGYETRLLNREDFNNDRVDAGDIGSGHTVTAIYELTPVGSPGRLVDALRYQEPQAADAAEETTATGTRPNEFGFLKIRYKLPDSDTSTLIERPVTRADEASSVANAPQEARFAAAVAAFGQLLTGGRYLGSYDYDDVVALAQSARGADPYGYRAEFITLVRLAKSAAALEPLPR